MRRDLVPAANAADMCPLHLDLREHRTNPALALAETFKRAHFQITMPAARAEQTLKQQVTSLRVFGVRFMVAPVEEPSEPDDEISRIGYWLRRVIDARRRAYSVIRRRILAIA